MLRYMLDTNICIYVIKKRPRHLREKFNTLSGQMAISAITVAELYYGAEKSQNRGANLAGVESFTCRLEILEFGAKAADHFGQIRSALEKEGKPIGPYDLLIAGHARSEGLTLVTNNEKEFSRVKGLLIENWVKP